MPYITAGHVVAGDIERYAITEAILRTASIDMEFDIGGGSQWSTLDDLTITYTPDKPIKAVAMFCGSATAVSNCMELRTRLVIDGDAHPICKHRVRWESGIYGADEYYDDWMGMSNIAVVELSAGSSHTFAVQHGIRTHCDPGDRLGDWRVILSGLQHYVTFLKG